MEKIEPTTKTVTCPVCKKGNARFNDNVGMYVCSDCGHEWADETQKDIQQADIGTGD